MPPGKLSLSLPDHNTLAHALAPCHFATRPCVSTPKANTREAISDDESDGELAVPIPTRGGRSSTSESKRGRSEDIAANGANGQDEQQDEEDDDEDMDEDEDEDEDVYGALVR